MDTRFVQNNETIVSIQIASNTVSHRPSKSQYNGFSKNVWIES